MATHKPVIINELFGELKVPEDENYRWVVIHCKPRCEKRLADYLGKRLINYYLPQIKHKRVYQRRKVVTTLPMFPGYLFAILGPLDREKIAISGLAVRFIRVGNQHQLLQELGRICGVTRHEVDLVPTMWLSKGLEVEITEGALKGTRGVVESHEKISEVRLQVEILRQAVLMSVDPKHVKIIGEYEIVEEES
ncbi:MAG: transcription termination/antitermination NusG family protein [Candidatus Cloacimonetes bacterium]|nr:transcription termination/antitermination NusG family protein [Candidatus Cloacimonadota bacterium]MDD3579055.1 UpxY family transcription antiterminator [Candidatus Cloacimonadota bacterium]MDD4035323.1 UpxY family transcription antiterminator [Candidatus Cloacimonadota bacterium]MDD4667915.1 UpxY family transcription antiterminator [Candidatus Cloacimonadota bacterium]MDY0337747.1 UpxY family transcription antiterminator [Candidatus Cloacimonadaceae bacterium]